MRPTFARAAAVVLRPAIFSLRLMMLGCLLVPFCSEAATKYWISHATKNFNDATRWSTTSGGANDTTAPGASDIAVFDANGTADCAMSATVSVAGISIVFPPDLPGPAGPPPALPFDSLTPGTTANWRVPTGARLVSI